MAKVRIERLPSNEVFVNVNDLIIALMLDVSKSTSESDRKVFNCIISRLTNLRDHPPSN